MQEGDERAFLFGVEVGPDLDDLGGVIEAKADLLDLLRLGGGAGSLDHQNLLVFGRHHLSVSYQACHLNGEVGSFGESETFCLTGIGDREVGA